MTDFRSIPALPASLFDRSEVITSNQPVATETADTAEAAPLLTGMDLKREKKEAEDFSILIGPSCATDDAPQNKRKT